jgi:moderate conductance mechanosensitive channel
MQNIKEFLDPILRDNGGSLTIIGKIASIVLIFFIISIMVKVANGIINRTFKDAESSSQLINKKRAKTLGEVLKKIVKYVLVFIGVMMALETFDIDTKSIIATAGIGGLAIGFGAQSLVKDLITGFFIIMEDQYSVGDFVQIDSFEGYVEDLGLRVTKLRDFSGELHIIPNGNIDIVTNKTRGAMRAKVDISIAYEENVDKAIGVLEKVCREIRENNEDVLDGPSVMGITGLGGSDVVLTIIAKTTPLEQWAVEREIRKKSKEALEREDIEIPYSKMVIIGGGEN